MAVARATPSRSRNQLRAATWAIPSKPPAGVGSDHATEETCGGCVGCFHAVAHGRFVRQVTFEDQAVGAVWLIYEFKVRTHRRPNALLVVGGGGHSDLNGAQKFANPLVEEGKVQIQFPREMLVENRLAYAGSVSDVVHSSDVVTLGHEHFAGSDEELSPTFLAG